MDVLGAARFGFGGYIVWWENVNGSGISWSEHIIDYFSNAASVYAEDMDDDGDMDVLAGALSGFSTKWYENADGSGTFWYEYMMDEQGYYHAPSVYSEDIDGNGAMDVLGAYSNGDRIVWWDITEFDYGGILTSSIFDIDDSGTMGAEWGTITWTDDVPADTTLTVAVAESDDPDNMSDWKVVNKSGDDLSDYIHDGTRYFQYKVTLESYNGFRSPTFEDVTINWNPVGIDGDEGNLPKTFALHPAAPNPSSGTASIGFALPRACEVELSLYDIKGRKIATLGDGTHQPGEYTTTVSGLSSGVYVYSITADEFSDSKKMVVR